MSEGRNIYGSVGPKEVAAALAAKGLEIDSKLITLKGVKTLGNYEAVARFHREVTVTIPVEVVNEEGEKAPAKKEAPKAEAPAEVEAPAVEEAPAEEAAAEVAE